MFIIHKTKKSKVSIYRLKASLFHRQQESSCSIVDTLKERKKSLFGLIGRTPKYYDEKEKCWI